MLRKIFLQKWYSNRETKVKRIWYWHWTSFIYFNKPKRKESKTSLTRLQTKINRKWKEIENFRWVDNIEEVLFNYNKENIKKNLIFFNYFKVLKFSPSKILMLFLENFENRTKDIFLLILKSISLLKSILPSFFPLGKGPFW